MGSSNLVLVDAGAWSRRPSKLKPSTLNLNMNCSKVNNFSGGRDGNLKVQNLQGDWSRPRGDKFYAS